AAVRRADYGASERTIPLPLSSSSSSLRDGTKVRPSHPRPSTPESCTTSLTCRGRVEWGGLTLRITCGPRQKNAHHRFSRVFVRTSPRRGQCRVVSSLLCRRPWWESGLE